MALPQASIDAEAALPQAAALHQAGQLQAAQALYQQVLQQQPDHPQALHLLGLAFLQQGDAGHAANLMQRALQVCPGHAQAWTHLGVALKAQGQLRQALRCHRQALALQPGLLDAQVNLGNVLHQAGRNAKALAAYDQALQQTPGHGPALASRLPVLMGLQRWAQAEQAGHHGLQAAPQDADLQFQTSLLHLLLGLDGSGWSLYEARWRRPAFLAQNPPRFNPARLWDGQAPLAGRSLLLLAEQGLGDALQCARYVPLLLQRGAHVFLETAAPLWRLMQGLALPPQQADRLECVPRGGLLPEADFHLPLMSLPGRMLGQERATPAPQAWTGPYLRAPGVLVAEWAARLGPRRGARPRVGLVWKAGDNPAGRQRHVPVALLGQALALGADYFSLQKDVTPDEAQTLGAAWPELRWTGAEQTDLADAAALIQAMDLVISVDTSLAHLAGALGKPVWILLPALPDARWQLARSRTTWYPTARLFRQPARGQWAPALQALQEALHQALAQWPGPASSPGGGDVTPWCPPEDAQPSTRAALRMLAQGRLHEAHAWARQALECAEDDALLHNHMGVIEHALGRHEQAVQSFARALALAPGLRAALINQAGALRDAGRAAQAQASLDQALAQDASDVAARWNKALLLLLQGQYARAWPLFESRWAPGGHCAALRRPQEPPRLSLTEPGPAWLPRGLRLLVTAEQGLGDTLQFARYLPLLAAQGLQVVAEVQPALVRLLAHSLQPLEAAGPSPLQVMALGAQPPKAELCVGMMSLAALHGTATPLEVPVNVPYLKVPPPVQTRWAGRVAPHRADGAPLVGLMWMGNPEYALNQRRSVGLEELLQALPAGPRYLSLQLTLGEQDQALLQRRPDVLHPGAEQQDMLDAAALCQCCDVVLTVDTSMAHLAGALGRPTWVLLHASADWRWGMDAQRSRWYPTARLFRQRRWGDWRGPLQEVASALAASPWAPDNAAP